MKKNIFILMIFCIALILNAEGGFQSLYLDGEPISIGMGEANGVFGFNYLKNPANTSNFQYFYLYANHSEYFIRTRYENFGGIFPTKIGAFGANITALYSDGIMKADENGIVINSDDRYYSLYNMMFSINYSKKINNFIFGINEKNLYFQADTFVTSGAILDLGAIIFTDKDYNIGISLTNITVLEGYAPLLLKVSGGYKHNKLKTIMDINYYIMDNSMFEISTGIEYDMFNNFAIRCGYYYNTQNENFLDNIRAGVTFSLGPISVNYASAYFIDLGLTHYIGVSYNHEKTMEKNKRIKDELLKEMDRKLHEKEIMMSNMFLNKAKDYLEEKNYNDALENIDIALIWDPENTEAELLKGMVEKNKKDWEISSLIDKGMDKYMSEDYVNAMRIFNEVLKIDSTNHQGKKYYEKAKLAYNKKIESSQKKGELDRGINYYSKGNYLKAKEIFSSIYNETKSEKSKKYLDMTNAKISEYIDKKINELEKQLKKNNFNYVIKTGKKLLKYKTKQSKINSLISKAETNKKAYIDTWLNKAISQYNAKNYKKAEEFFQRVIVIDTLNKTASDYLKKIKSKNIYSSEDIGELYLKGIEAYTNNNYKLAIKYWEQCLDINPNYKKASKNIEKAKKKLNELENL